MSRTNELQNWLSDESATINNFSEIAPKTETTEFSKVGDKVNDALTNVGHGVGRATKKLGSGVFRAGQKLNTSPKAQKVAGAVALGAAGLAAGAGAAAIAKHAAKKRDERDEAVKQQAIEEYKEEQKAARQNQNKPKQIAASEFSEDQIDEVINNSVAEFSEALNKEFGEETVTEDVEKTDSNGNPTEEEISETINNSFSEYCELFSEMGLFGECNFSDYDMNATCEAAFNECEDKMVDAIIEKAEKEYDESEDGNFSDYLADTVAFSVACNYFGFSDEDFSDENFGIKEKIADFRAKRAAAKAEKEKKAYKVGLGKDKKGNLTATEKNTQNDPARLKAAKAWAKGNKKSEIDLIKKYGNTGKAARAAAWGSAQKDSLIKSLGGGNKKKGQAKLDEYKRMATDAAMTGISRKLSGESNQRDEEAV